MCACHEHDDGVGDGDNDNDSDTEEDVRGHADCIERPLDALSSLVSFLGSFKVMAKFPEAGPKTFSSRVTQYSSTKCVYVVYVVVVSGLFRALFVVRRNQFATPAEPATERDSSLYKVSRTNPESKCYSTVWL